MAFARRTIFIERGVTPSILVDNLDVRDINVEDSGSDSDESGSSGSMQAVGGTRKRRRLTNLTPEEKMMRRKLKNRVAAQTARDRKKQRMCELEEALAIMEAENRKLQAENTSLKVSTNSLSRENHELKQRLDTPVILEEESEEPSVDGEISAAAVVVATGKLPEPESAALSCPQQKDQARAILSLATTYYLCTAFMIISLMQCFTLWTNMSKVSASKSIREEMIPGQKNSPTVSLQSRTSLDPLVPPWWGSHQRNWNPSMNS
jgi:X box-binding protein 1